MTKKKIGRSNQSARRGANARSRKARTDKQLDSGKQRGKRDRGRASVPATSTPTIQAAIETRYSTSTIAEIERIDLRGYLNATNHVDDSSAERLRQLAIFFEDKAAETPVRGWLALARIYQHAAQLAKDNSDLSVVLRSHALSASYLAEAIPSSAAKKTRRIWAVAYSAIHRSIGVCPEWADAHSLLSDIRFRDPNGDLEEALADAERALMLNPNFGWAQYHRAQILHSLSRYREAAQAYADIQLSFFDGEQSWRQEAILESRAYCWFRAGERRRALEEFCVLVARYERAPSLAALADWWCLVEVATGDFREELGVRTKELVRRYANYHLDEFADVDDCENFSLIVQSLLSGLVEEHRPELVCWMKLDRQFSQNWRDFLGRSPGHYGIDGRASVRIPPFPPRRVLSEIHYSSVANRRYGQLSDPVRLQTYARNQFVRRRTLSACGRPFVWLWYSGGTRSSKRGSVMAYIADGEHGEESWHLEYAKSVDGQWQPSSLQGIGRDRLASIARTGLANLDYHPWQS